MARPFDNDEENVKLRRKYDNLEKTNKELTEYVNIIKKNFDDNKLKIIPLQEENSVLIKTLIEKNQRIQALESQVTTLIKEDKSKAVLIIELNEKLNKYKEIFQFVTQKKKFPLKRPNNDSFTYSVPYDDKPKKHGNGSPSLTDIDNNSSPPMLPRTYSSVIPNNHENKLDFSRKTVGKRSSNDFMRDTSKIQEFQKDIEQFYSFDKKKNGFSLKFQYISMKS